MEYGDQFCSWVCNIDIDDDDDDGEVYSDDEEDAAYADKTQPPNPKLILTNSSANATDCLFVFGWMYRLDNRGIIA